MDPKVPGCTTESFGAVPVSERKIVSAYVEATESGRKRVAQR